MLTDENEKRRIELVQKSGPDVCFLPLDSERDEVFDAVTETEKTAGRMLNFAWIRKRQRKD